MEELGQPICCGIQPICKGIRGWTDRPATKTGRVKLGGIVTYWPEGVAGVGKTRWDAVIWCGVNGASVGVVSVKIGSLVYKLFLSSCEGCEERGGEVEDRFREVASKEDGIGKPL